MYAGLTTADKGALLDAKARGAEWVIVQWGGKAFGYKEKPKREEITDECCYGSYFEWSAQDGDHEIELGFMPYPLVSYQSPEPVNIDLALAQIAEMERKTVTRTNQDALLERYKNVDLFAVDIAAESYVDDYGMYFLPDGSKAYSEKEATDLARKWLLSPHTEGETK